MQRSDSTRVTGTAGRYPSLESFYSADPRRGRSREQDVGLWWREEADGPLHRAAWVNDTGELYLARLGPEDGEDGRVEVLARIEDYERLESAFAGWRERCGEPRSLSWLRERARELRARTRARQARIIARVPVAGDARRTPSRAVAR
jgi:hypothetical protein